MFDKNYEDRLAVWSDFRQALEDSQDPYQDVINFYQPAPTVSIHCDPFDQDRWPTPWELILENQYCDFSRVLGYCFSLQLTERFSGSNFEIHITTSEEKPYLYLLIIDNKTVLGYNESMPVAYNDIKSVLESQVIYSVEN